MGWDGAGIRLHYFSGCCKQSRLILPVLFFISEESGLNNWLALFLFVLAGVTDNLDGYIARKTGTESSLGALLDLLADKLLVIITTAYLISYQTHENLLIFLLQIYHFKADR